MEDIFFIDGYKLDKYQIDCIKCNKNLLVIAGAGCGKTSTILGKVKYLVHNGVKEDEILCMSLTNEATNNLRNKLTNMNLEIDCLTFHKLGLNIIKNKYRDVNIVNNLLDYIVNEYFNSVVRYSYRKYWLFLEFRCINYLNILRSESFKIYKNSIVTFINLLKNKGLDKYHIYNLYKNSLIKHNYLFLLEIYTIYSRELESNNSFDFNDMINISSELVKKENINLKYKYIIIDEFQDSSKIRLELIKNIIKNNNATIMCVGDDYQSIYRFAGSDLDIFFNFNKYFKNSEIKFLKNTYRNSQELLFITSSFICKNKYQIKKELYSNKSNSKPIKIYYCSNKIYTFYKLLEIVGNNYMVIGRNNDDIKKYVNNIDDINSINYFTAHKSKGLESENTILINLTNNILGFPSKIKNNKLISKLFKNEFYKYDEERRLFYVALTRTRNNVYILVEKDNISEFIIELIKDYNKYIEICNI